MSRITKRRTIPVVGVLVSMTAAGLAANDAAAHPAEVAFKISAEAPIYAVVQEGMTQDEANALAERTGVKPALGKDGSFSYVDSRRFAKVPSTTGVKGRDEDGHPTLQRKVNFTALKAITTYDPEKALSRARELLDAPSGFDVTPKVGHTRVDLSGRGGKPLGGFDLDTTVSYRLALGQAPVVGPGSRSRISFAGDGSVIALEESLRRVEQAGSVGIISPEEALQVCQSLYGERVGEATPKLVYYSPQLTGQGQGSVKFLLPHYACQPKSTRGDAVSNIVGRLVPAAPELTPTAQLQVSRDGSLMTGKVAVDGGTAPYSIQWASSSTRLLRGGESVSYKISSRARARTESLTATITDANGIVTAASAAVSPAGGEASSAGYGGAGGSLGSVGIEQTVDEWQCAQDSANGFRSEMLAHSQSVNFDWRGTNAWERDFHKTQTGGNDSNFVDAVDAQWYTGHGSPGGFTFKSSVDDTSIVPGDARWGDNFNLEWMQLESCQVLQDTNGFNDYFGRWAPAFDGLHLLNGFHTNAYCIGGGTGARFAHYLFPDWWRGPLTVSQAWAAMANDLEPSGVRWRSISPAGAGWVHNLDDHYWGQGSTGPDIPASQRIGFIAISGVV
jgi:hypothetical protein